MKKDKQLSAPVRGTMGATAGAGIGAALAGIPGALIGGALGSALGYNLNKVTTGVQAARHAAPNPGDEDDLVKRLEY